MFNKILNFLVVEKNNNKKCFTLMGKNRNIKKIVLTSNVDKDLQVKSLSDYFVGLKSLASTEYVNARRSVRVRTLL